MLGHIYDIRNGADAFQRPRVKGVLRGCRCGLMRLQGTPLYTQNRSSL